jgi:polyketide biosynthesis enoyl-CoA hydratase PksH
MPGTSRFYAMTRDNRVAIKRVRNVLFMRMTSDDGKNCIDDQLVSEMDDALSLNADFCTVIVLEGNEDHFCLGADIVSSFKNDRKIAVDPGRLYSLWKRLRFGEFITIAHVRGDCVAGGIGFVASADIVVSSINAKYMLSEMFFNLYPACVLPFLANRIGMQRANLLTLLCKKIDSDEANRIGLVDIVDSDSDSATRKCIAQVARHSRHTISKYKRYMGSVSGVVEQMQEAAVRENIEMFSDEIAIERVKSYLSTHRH